MLYIIGDIDILSFIVHLQTSKSFHIGYNATYLSIIASTLECYLIATYKFSLHLRRQNTSLEHSKGTSYHHIW